MPRPSSKKNARPGRKRGSYTQAQRLIELYDRLCQGAAIRVDSAAEELDASTRQIERDLALLRKQLGDRIEQRPDRSWHMPHQKKRAHEGRVAVAQVLALEIGAKLSAFLWEPGTMREIETAMGALRRELVSHKEQRLRTWRRRVAVIAPGQKDYARRPDLGSRLNTLLEAMLHEKPVSLSYRSHNAALAGTPPRRLCVHPLGIVFYRDGVYFIVDVAEDRDGTSDILGKRILLAVDRMDGLEVGLAGRFTVPADFDAREFFGDAFGIVREREALDVVVEIDAAHAPWVLERTFHPKQQVEQRTDGSVLLRMRVSGRKELSDWILSLGEHAEVVEPPELRALVRRRLLAAAERYGEEGDIFWQTHGASSSHPRGKEER